MRCFFVFLFLLSFCFANAQNTVGLIQNDEASFNGYTLFSPSADSSTYLIDNCGQLVNQWKGGSRPGQTAILREDGLLLRCEFLSAAENSQWGGGAGGKLVLYDWEGEVQWEFPYGTDTYFQHHEAVAMPNGNVLIMAWDSRTEDDALANGRRPDFLSNELWSEKVVELRPIGNNQAEVVWEWFLWDHLVQDFDDSKLNFGNVAEHPELIDLNYVDVLGGAGGGPTAAVDWIHLNAIDYNEELDQIVLSSRNFNEVWVIDHSTTTEEAAGSSGGSAGKGGDILYRWGNPLTYDRGSEEDQVFFSQHNARWIKNLQTGAHRISVFNNGLGREPIDYSSIDIISPPLDGSTYSIDDTDAFLPQNTNVFYGNTDTQFIFSVRISSAQQLPNGNFLIDIGLIGRFIEVNPQGNVVWSYINPIGAFGAFSQGEQPFGNNVFNITRYGENFAGFDGLNLIGNGFIEEDPTPFACQIIPEVDVGIDDQPNFIQELNLSVYPVPSTDFVNISLDNNVERDLKVVDLLGREVFHSSVFDFKRLNVSDLSPGLFFILLDGHQAGSFVKY